jgi:hypothetical protein
MEAGSLSPRSSGLLLGLPLLLLAGLIGVVMSIALVFSGAPSCGGEVGGLSSGVPKRLVPIYEQAAAKYSLGEEGPSILAAVNWVETGFGANMGPSSAGAEGWMQFLPESWETYGVDGDGNGRKDPDDPWDAIPAAARLLRASGAPKDWRAAIFSYNHADWYVAEVLSYAKRFAGSSGGSVEVAASVGCASAAVAPNKAVARMIVEAERLSAIRPQSEYVWGGSHGETPTPPNGPFDCSSAVSHLLQVGGFHNPTMDTVALLGWAEPGPGRWVSIYDKPYGADAHTFIEFRVGLTPPSERFWGTSGIFKGLGPGWITRGDFSTEYLSGFRVLHPPGL